MAADAKKDTPAEEEPWSPDPRWAVPAVLAISVWAAGWTPRIASHDGGGFSPWWMALGGVGAALVGWAMARRSYPHQIFGVGLAEQASLLAWVNGISVGSWLVYAGLTSPWKATGFLILGAFLLGGWFYALTSLAPRRAEEEHDRHQAADAADHDQVTRDLLDRAGCIDVRMYGRTEHRGGYTVEIGPDPDADDPPTYNDVVRRRDKLTTHLAMHWRRKGIKIRAMDVNIEELEADRWLLHVSTNHVLEQNVPFLPDRSNNGMPPSFNMPLLLGLYEDGRDMRAKLCGRHLKLVGVTGGGKSVFLNNLIGRTLECRADDGRPDGMVFVAATDKLLPLVYNWLVPWFSGTTSRPAIAWVAGEERADVNRFLVGLYDLVVDRNNRLSRKTKHEATPDMPGILAILEEAKLMTTVGAAVRMSADGEPEVWWTTSRLINMILALARSAAVSVVVALQDGLFDGLGDYGNEMMRNFSLRACTLTMTASDGMNTLPALPATVDTTQLEHNSMYLQNGIGEKSRAMAGKAGFLDEEKVIPVATSVSQQLADLPDRDIDAIGRELWESRWDEDILAALARAAREDHLAPNGRGYDWPRRPVAAPSPPPPPPAPPVAQPAAAGAAPTAVMPDPGDHDDRNVDPDDIDWDRELRALTAAASPTPPTGPEAYGLPGQDAIDRLAWWARECEREAAEYEQEHGIGGGGDGGGGAPDPGGHHEIRPLPEPLRSVLAYINEQGIGGVEFVPTAELADAVLGEGVADGTTKLGQALAKNVPGLRAHKDAKVYPAVRGRPAGRGRGYWAADIRRAAEAYEDGREFS